METNRSLVGIGLGYVLLASFIKPSLPFPDLTDFWVPAARTFLAGHPQDLYSIHLEIFGQRFPNSYPPLFFAILAPFVGLADALGLPYGVYQPGSVGGGFGDAIVGLPLVGADLVLAWILYRLAARRWSAENRVWLFVLILAQPLVGYASIKLQHHESMLLSALVGSVWCLEEGRWKPAILLATLALCLKTTALIALPILVLETHRRHGWKAAFGMVAIPVLGLLALLAPWLLWRWQETLYALVGFESLRPVFGISTPKLLLGLVPEDAIRRLSNLVLLLGTTMTGGLLLGRGRSLRQALAAAYLVGLLAARWIYPHYLLVPCVLILLWEMEEPSFPRWSLLSASVLWGIQAPYFPEITLEAGAGIALRSGVWTVGILALLVKVSWRRKARADAP